MGTASVGRPSEFVSADIPKIAELARQGATDAEIADYIGVHVNTIGRWKQQHREFRWALKKGREIADERVEASLYRRALGYELRTEKIFCKDGEVTRVPQTEYVQPDVTAQIFWLKNRKPQEWRESRDSAPAITLNVSGIAAERLLNQLVQSTPQQSNPPMLDCTIDTESK